MKLILASLPHSISVVISILMCIRKFQITNLSPMGKMMLGFSGILAQYNGTFDFESGSKYPDEINYGIMRMYCAFFGALIVPLAYLTGVQLKFSKLACILCASMAMMGMPLLT